LAFIDDLGAAIILGFIFIFFTMVIACAWLAISDSKKDPEKLAWKLFKKYLFWIITGSYL